MSNDLAVIDGQGQSQALMPVMPMEQAMQRRQAIVDFTKQIMVKDTDYGQIPGTGGKPTLFKPGAEKLTTFFGLSPRFVIDEKDLDWTGENHGGEPFFYFQYRCQLWRGDTLVGEGLGSCNSWEKKYRYRKGGRICPECEAEAISRSKFPPRGAPSGTPKGWWCRECKTDYAFDDQRIQGQSTGRVPNDNPADLVNTIDKMAQKRALVAATLIAVNASEFFTQDIEDMDFGAVEGSYEEVDDEPPAGHGHEGDGNGGNGHGAPDSMEQALARVRKTAKAFFPALTDVTGWDDEKVKGAAKMLGMSKIFGDERRLNQFKSIAEYANLIDSGIENDLAIAVVNEVITREEAEAQMAAVDDAGEEE